MVDCAADSYLNGDRQVIQTLAATSTPSVAESGTNHCVSVVYNISIPKSSSSSSYAHCIGAITLIALMIPLLLRWYLNNHCNIILTIPSKIPPLKAIYIVPKNFHSANDFHMYVCMWVKQCCGSGRFLTGSGSDFRKRPDPVPDPDLNESSAKFLLEILAEIFF
jgi:hypothetical protein